MGKWNELVESLNSQYRDDYYSRVICESLLLKVEEKNLMDNVTHKMESYLSDNNHLDALIKACHDFNITANYE